MSRGRRVTESPLPDVFAVWPPGGDRGEVADRPDACRSLTASDVLDSWREEHGSREVPRAVMSLVELLGSGDLEVTAVASGSEIVFVIDGRNLYDRAPEGPPPSEVS